MVKRHHQVDFASGALVFPGGKLQPGDSDPVWRDRTSGWNELDEIQRALRIGAIREAFEEAGILLARYPDGSPFTDVCDVGERAAVDRGELPFLDVVRRLGVLLELDALTVFARWITPTFMPKRFDTWFYAVDAPAGQVAACDGREAVDAEWIAPGEALRLAGEGSRTVIFPTRMNLRLLAEANSAADCLTRAAARAVVPVLPEVVVEGADRYMIIPPEAGYGVVREPLDQSARGG